MEELHTEETLVSEEQEIQRPVRRRREPPKRRFAVPSFLKNIGVDVRWYYDVRLWSPLILILLLLTWLPGKKTVEAPPVQETEPAVMETEPVTEPEPEPIIPEAEELARLADSVGAGRSKNAKIIIMWVAVNRSEDQRNGFGKSIAEEIARPNQWQNYDPNVSYSEETYQLAKQVLETKQNGDLRPLEPDMLWLVLNDNGSVTTRNKFAVGPKETWVEKTVK